MILNETAQQYKQLIKEELGVQNETKLNWMAQMAQIHAIHEGVQPNTVNVANGIYATPLNTLGMGNPGMPMAGQPTTDGSLIGNTSNDFHSPAYVNGSGDVPMSTLSMALEIAAVTIGFDLVPVVPAAGPWAMLTFNDYPYAGGKLGRTGFETAFDGIGPEDENKPIYIKVNAEFASVNNNVVDRETLRGLTHKDGNEVWITSGNGTVKGTFVGFSRIDDNIIIRIIEAKNGNDNVSIATVFSGTTPSVIVKAKANTAVTTDITASNAIGGTYRPELVKGVSDHIQGFANFYDESEDPMTRAQNETGTGNTIGARIFSKMIQMGAYEVTGAVTRQQLQDMPLYGIDVIGGVLETCQNEISQHWNNRILDRVFKLGVTNYEIQRKYQKADLNLYIAGPTDPQTKQLNAFSGYSKFVDINGNKPASVAITNAIRNTAAENVTTHQRRIMSRCLAASNLISSVTRKGRAQWIVCNAQVLTALQDCSQFVVAPMANNLVQGGDESLYFAGTLAGMSVYVDPFMTWDDTRICVGRKANVSNNRVNGSGVVFMPYILADTVQIVAEGTMAPKMLVNSRAAVVDAGFYPEQNYYTFMVDFADGMML